MNESPRALPDPFARGKPRHNVAPLNLGVAFVGSLAVLVAAGTFVLLRYRFSQTGSDEFGPNGRAIADTTLWHFATIIAFSVGGLIAILALATTGRARRLLAIVGVPMLGAATLSLAVILAQALSTPGLGPNFLWIAGSGAPAMVSFIVFVGCATYGFRQADDGGANEF